MTNCWVLTTDETYFYRDFAVQAVSVNGRSGLIPDRRSYTNAATGESSAVSLNTDFIKIKTNTPTRPVGLYLHHVSNNVTSVGGYYSYQGDGSNILDYQFASTMSVTSPSYNIFQNDKLVFSNIGITLLTYMRDAIEYKLTASNPYGYVVIWSGWTLANESRRELRCNKNNNNLAPTFFGTASPPPPPPKNMGCCDCNTIASIIADQMADQFRLFESIKDHIDLRTKEEIQVFRKQLEALEIDLQPIIDRLNEVERNLWNGIPK